MPVIKGQFDGSVGDSNPGNVICWGAWYELGDDTIPVYGYEPCPNVTNNIAEYRALIELLEALHKIGITKVHISGDSKLVVNQVNNEWNCNVPHLRVLLTKAQQLSSLFEVFNLTWIPRNHNKHADSLAYKAFMRYCDAHRTK